MKASLENGLLTVTVPKAQAPAPFRVPVTGVEQTKLTDPTEQTK